MNIFDPSRIFVRNNLEAEKQKFIDSLKELAEADPTTTKVEYRTNNGHELVVRRNGFELQTGSSAGGDFIMTLIGHKGTVLEQREYYPTAFPTSSGGFVFKWDVGYTSKDLAQSIWDYFCSFK